MTKKRRILTTAFLVFLAIVMVFPLLLNVCNSFMTDREIKANYDIYNKDSSGHEEEDIFFALKLIPQRFVLDQYYQVLVKKPKFLRMFWNSLFIVLPMVIGQIIISSMAAFAFAKLRFKGRDSIFFLYIVAMMMPFQVTLVPNYLVLDKLGLIDSYLSIIFPGIFGAFGVFLLRQFMLSIPDACIEAAKIDGCNFFYIFVKIILPMSKEGIAALAILFYIDYWNMVEQPLIFLKDVNKYPLSIYMAKINQSEIGVAFAASVIYMLPVLLIFLYWENYLVEGINRSGIKS